MKMRSLVSVLAGGCVMLVAGAAFSGGMMTCRAELQSYDRTTSELWAVPDGQPLTSYLNQEFTVYAAADLAEFTPPDPCFVLARAWNFVVDYDEQTGKKSTFVFEMLLTAQSDLACHATVTSITSGTPQPLVVIQPTH
jgi:hypothetical protein